ncbi:MAG: hypothetical protein KGQ41_07270 [Alphaproteobacteria bacterium]|nr:hypothetical protein [Alphaproteobacteria bacterium]
MTRALALILVSALSLTLAACGFTPVYGTYSQNAEVSKSLDGVYIDVIPDRTGQKLRNLLIDRMVADGRNAAVDSPYHLRVSGLTESIYGIGIAKDDTATRSQIRINAVMTLTDTRTPESKVAISRQLSAVASFNTLASQYTTLVTEEDARNQAIQELATNIVTQLELYFSNPAAFAQPSE